MQINLFNSLNPNGKRVPVNVIIEHADKVSTNDGELVYLISIHTGAKSLSGGRIDTIYIDGVTKTTFREEVSKALTTLGDQIDWQVLLTDTHAPRMLSVEPENNDLNVSIHKPVYLSLKDPFPASFINLSTVKLKANGVDVTAESQVIDKNNTVNVFWSPKKILN